MKTALVVLGMHRSGTSAVAGSLAMAGVTPPTSLMPAKADNPLGFWESERIARFNDDLLDAAGSRWDDWGPLSPTVFDDRLRQHFTAATTWLLQVEFGDARTAVLKDPRICRFYPIWREQLVSTGFRPVVISPIRSPDQVARSLATRNGMAVALGLRLWLRHVLDAELASRGQPRHIATLDAFAQDWRARFERISSDLDVELDWRGRGPGRKIDRFWARRAPPIAKRRGEGPGTWNPLIRRTWNAFRDISAHGETPAALKALDRVRADLDVLMPLFYDRAPPR